MRNGSPVEARTAAVIVAAGAGIRCGGGHPKQFRELGGRPLLEWTLRAFRFHPAIHDLVAVLPSDVAADPPAWLRELADRTAAGGRTRRESVGRGLQAVAPAADVILVHDGVRPFVSAALIGRVAAAAARGPAAPVIPVHDTVKSLDGEGRIASTLERARIRRVQTPQGFPAEVIRRVHRDADAAGPAANEDADEPAAPDDAALCEEAGEPVAAVDGEASNLKITTLEDLAFAGWLIETGRVALPSSPPEAERRAQG